MKLYLSLLTVAFLAISPAFAADKTTPRPVVVEYFTSQGCSSCPPADAFLKDDLSKRDDVISLAYHVDYWDDLGWKDTFSQHGFTTRQYAYKRAMSEKDGDAGRVGVYTPQMVVDGRFAAVGSDRHTVTTDITTSKSTQVTVPITLRHENGVTQLDLPATDNSEGPATLWLVSYLKSVPVTITRGENTGRTITYVNIVRDMQALVHWNGKAITVTLPELSVDKSYVALLQSDQLDPVLGVIRIR